MADSFVVAPSVQWTERDATLATLSGVTRNAALVGEFAWGPAEYPVRVTGGEIGLVQNFWKPTKDIWLDFMVMMDYFRYSSSAWVVRVLREGATNAIPADGVTPSTLLLKNFDEIESYTGAEELFAKYAGDLGNNLNTYVMGETERLAAKADFDKGFRGGLASLWTLLEDKSPLVADKTFNVLVFDATGALGGSVPATTLSRKKLVVEWPTVGDNPGLYLGIQSGNQRIKLQWTGSTAPTSDAELAVALIAQFQAVPENIRRLNNIKNIALNGTEDFEVEFYNPLTSGQVWFASAEGTLGGSTAATDIVQDTFGVVVERFYAVSVVEGDTRYDGSAAYYVDTVNQNSQYIAFGPSFETDHSTGFFKLRNGSNGGSAVASRQAGYDLLNSKNFDFLAFIEPGVEGVASQQGGIDLSVARRNSVTFVSPPREFKDASRALKMQKLREWRNNDLLRDNSYFMMDDNWGEFYDKYNKVYRYIPCCGGTAGLWFRSIGAAGIGKSPAYYNRGKYLGYRRMAWSANDDERSELFNDLNINSIVSEKEGIILMGSKTGLSRSSAFNRLPVRGIFIELETNIADTAKYVLGEDNDTFTQNQFRISIEPYLRRKKDAGEITDFRVKADETNNTAQVKVENKFVAGIWIKPKYMIDWVYLDFVALRPDMEFSELEGNIGLVGF